MSRYRAYKYSKPLTPYFRESICLLEGCNNPVRWWVNQPAYFCCKKHRGEWQRGRGRGAMPEKITTTIL